MIPKISFKNAKKLRDLKGDDLQKFAAYEVDTLAILETVEITELHVDRIVQLKDTNDLFLIISYTEVGFARFKEVGSSSIQDKLGDKTVEIFVAKTGSDTTGSGSRISPYLTIQKGIDSSIEIGGHTVKKIVRVMPGTSSVFTERAYIENVIVNTRGLELIGHWGDQVFDKLAEIYSYLDSAASPALMYTNMTKVEALQYSADGGGDYSHIGGIYSYDGATLLGRQTWDKENPTGDLNDQPLNRSGNDSTIINAEFKIKDFILGHATAGGIWGSHNTVFAAVIVPEVDTDLLVMGSGIVIENVFFSGTNPEIFCKNINTFELAGETSCVSAHFGKMMFDNCTKVKLGTISRMGAAAFSFNENSPNGAPYSGNFFAPEGQTSDIATIDGALLFLGHSDAGRQEMGSVRELHTHGNIEVYNNFQLAGSLAGTVAMRHVSTKQDIICDGTEFISDRMECDNFTKTATADGGKNVSIGRAIIRKNLFVDSGTVFISGGVIVGDVVVEDGATIDFTNVTVKGNIVLGDSTVLWRGGSFYGTLIDPEGALGAVAGEYINIV